MPWMRSCWWNSLFERLPLTDVTKVTKLSIFMYSQICCTHTLLDGFQHGLLFFFLPSECYDTGFLFTQMKSQVYHLLFSHLWRRQQQMHKVSREYVMINIVERLLTPNTLSHRWVWSCSVSHVCVFLLMSQVTDAMTAACPERAKKFCWYGLSEKMLQRSHKSWPTGYRITWGFTAFTNAYVGLHCHLWCPALHPPVGLQQGCQRHPWLLHSSSSSLTENPRKKEKQARLHSPKQFCKKSLLH